MKIRHTAIIGNVAASSGGGIYAYRGQQPGQPGDGQADRRDLSRDVWAVQLPADEPALELVWWPREAPGKEPAPIDALLVTRREGRGRIVLCQLPMGPWQQDPRSQILLRNALDYLLTRPEPTRRPSERAPASQPTGAGDAAKKTDPARVLPNGGSS